MLVLCSCFGSNGRIFALISVWYDQFMFLSTSLKCVDDTGVIIRGKVYINVFTCSKYNCRSLWSYQIYFAVMWSADNHKINRNKLNFKRLSEYQFSTWSWPLIIEGDCLIKHRCRKTVSHFAVSISEFK